MTHRPREGDALEKTLKLGRAQNAAPGAASLAEPPPVAESVSVAGRRGHNEDTVVVLQGVAGEVPVTLLAVADGMGGHARGEVASRLAAEAVRDAWGAGLDDLADAFSKDPDAASDAARTLLRGAFLEAERRIAAEADGSGMGTTLVAALVAGDRALFANVGDSRGYLLDAAGVRQVTEDHSVVADAIRQGAMSAAEAVESPYQHALTRSIDGSGDAEPDLFPPDGWLPLPAGAVALLGSDGLYGPLTEDDVHEHVVRTPDLRTAARRLVTTALDRGSADNVTVAALERGSVARRPDLLPGDEAHENEVLAANTEREDAETEDRPTAGRIGRTPWVLALVGLALAAVAVGLWRWAAPEPDAPGFVMESADGALAWEVTGDFAPGGFAVFVYPSDEAPTDSAVVVRTSRPAVAPADLAKAWPGGEVPAGQYRWRVEAYGTSADGTTDTLRSPVSRLDVGP